MSGILEQMLRSQRFTPCSTNEYFALQLARRLRDDAAIKLYLRYVERHSPDQLLNIFQKVRLEPEPARAFHSSLAPHDS